MSNSWLDVGLAQSKTVEYGFYVDIIAPLKNLGCDHVRDREWHFLRRGAEINT
jgi:hypothetical protein